MNEPQKIVLDNGLTILIQESHNAPVVSMNLCCKVGSRYEGPKEAGICHLIEHMIFKGTPKYPVGEIARQVEASGGDINAYTSFDETVFYINMASEFMKEGLDILIDAALNPLFDSEELTREKEVVVEEISRSEDSPGHQVSEDIFRTSFQRHPYGNPIAGSRESVRAISRQQLLSFYKRWYVGPNLIFVLCGDFETIKILPRLKKLLNGFSNSPAPRIKIPKEPKQRRPRARTRTMDVKGSYLALAFHTPELVHPDVPALDVLSHILSGGESSRLDQSLKENQGLVRAIDTACYTPVEPCLFFVDAELTRSRPKQVIHNILKELYKLHAELVSPGELMRAKTNLKSAQVYERETVEGLCRKLGFFEITAGDYLYEETYYEAVAAVTPEKIQEVACRYLNSNNLNLAFCHPKGEEKAISKQQLLSGLPKPPKKTRRRAVKKSGDIQCFFLPGGLRLIVKENPLVPLVSIRSASLGGIRSETVRNNGLSNLISDTTTKGTIHRNALEIASQIETMAGSISGYAGRNLLGLKATFLSEKLDEGLDLFADVLCNPTFDKAEVQKEKKHILTAIRDQGDVPARMAMREFVQKLFPDHPYRFPILGTANTVRSLSSNQLISAYRKWVRPDNLVVSVVGHVNAEHIREVLFEHLQHLPANKSKAVRHKSQRPPRQPVRSILRRKGMQQAHIVTGFLGAVLNTPDRYGIDVLNAVLAGQGGRLFLELRDRQSLCYTVSTAIYEGMERGFIAVYMGTDPEKLSTAESGIIKELEKVVTKPISRAELERAKRYLIGTYSLDLQRNSSISALLAYDEIYGLGYADYLNYSEQIKRVTCKQVQQLAQKYLKLDQSVTVIVKP